MSNYGDPQEAEAAKLLRLKQRIEDATAGSPVPEGSICPGGCPLNYAKPWEHCDGCTSEAMDQHRRSCFYCGHLILDGMDSWCEKGHRAGKPCEDFNLNTSRLMACEEAAE